MQLCLVHQFNAEQPAFAGIARVRSGLGRAEPLGRLHRGLLIDRENTAGFVGLHDHRVTHILRYGKTQPLIFKHFFSGSAVRRGGFGSFFGLAGGAARGRQDQRGAEKQKK